MVRNKSGTNISYVFMQNGYYSNPIIIKNLFLSIFAQISPVGVQFFLTGRQMRGKQSRRRQSHVAVVWQTILQCSKLLDKILRIFRRVYEITKRHYQLRHVRLSICLSVRMEQLRSHWMEFDKTRYLSFFSENLQRKFKFY